MGMYAPSRSRRRRLRPRPCPTICQYRLDPGFGWMHARVQTWFQFYIHVCINGREWLSRHMDQEGLRYFCQEHCFPWSKTSHARDSSSKNNSR